MLKLNFKDASNGYIQAFNIAGKSADASGGEIGIGADPLPGVCLYIDPSSTLGGADKRTQGGIRIGPSDTSGGQLQFVGHNGNIQGFQIRIDPSNVIWTLPIRDGLTNQVLETDGAGQLSWRDLTDVSFNDISVNDISATNIDVSGLLHIKGPSGILKIGDCPITHTNGAITLDCSLNMKHHYISDVSGIYFTNGCWIDASNNGGSQNDLELHSSGGYVKVDEVRHKGNRILHINNVTYMNGTEELPSIVWSNGTVNAPTAGTHHTGFYQSGNNKKMVGITCSGEKIATFWNQDPSSAGDISGGIQFYRDLSMNCHTIGDVSGIYWCDGTYIGPGSSFDISTNHLHFNITVGDVSNALQLDNSGNLKIGGIHSNGGYKFGWDNNNCRLGVGSQPPTLPGGTIYVTDLSGRDISSVAGVWINQQYRTTTIIKNDIFGEIIFSSSHEGVLPDSKHASIKACASQNQSHSGMLRKGDLRFSTRQNGPTTDSWTFRERMRITEIPSSNGTAVGIVAHEQVGDGPYC